MCPLEIDHYLEAATLRLCGSKGQKSYRICYDQSCKRENAAPDLRQGNAHACCAQKTVRGGGGGGGGGRVAICLRHPVLFYMNATHLHTH